MQMLLSEALNFSEHWVETNFIELAIEALNRNASLDDYFASDVCRMTSEIITLILVEQLPDFGATHYAGKITVTIYNTYMVTIKIFTSALNKQIYNI